MDMLNILKNFDDASVGKKTSTSADKSDMKAILESFNRASQPVEECGGMPMASPAMNQGTPVSMNVSINASGKDNVDDLIALMKAVQGAGGDSAMSSDHNMDMGAMRAIVMGPEDSEDDMEEEWDNSPDEEYSDHETMTQDLSGGINRQKKSFKAAQPGDNAMAVESVKERLWAALNEKRMSKKKTK